MSTSYYDTVSAANDEVFDTLESVCPELAQAIDEYLDTMTLA